MVPYRAQGWPQPCALRNLTSQVASEYVCLPSHLETGTQRRSHYAPASLLAEASVGGQTLGCFLGCFSPVGAREASTQPDIEEGIILNGTYNGAGMSQALQPSLFS